MVDDTSRLSKPVAFGIIGISLLIVLVLTIQLAVGALAFDYYPYVIIFAYISNLLILPALAAASLVKKSMKVYVILWGHFSMGVMLLYFSQTYSPFTVTWAILILLSSIYYRWLGFWLSSTALIVLATLYVILFPENLVNEGGVVGYSFLSALVVALTIFTAYMFVTTIMTAQKKNTELLKAQQSEQLQVNRLNTLLNSISDAVVTLNRYGRVTSQNAAAQAFFDTNQSLIGREIDNLFELRGRSTESVTVRELIHSVKTTLIRDDITVGADDDARHLSLQLSRIRGTFNEVVLIIRDITKQKSLEEEKDAFISVTSHELRTPVAIAEGSLSNLLLLEERSADRTKLRNAAEDAHKQVIYLSRMINDLSTLSRAERGVGDVIEEIDVDALMHDLFKRYTPEAEAKSLKLDLDLHSPLPKITTSRLYLEEILQNFITNSIKYTKEGSVTMGARIEGSDSIMFSVKDTGIGMSKVDQRHIFEKFYRSEDYRTRETNGTGLGLYVVSKLAQKLNTKINVESRLDHGSQFSFALALKTLKFGAGSPKKSEASKEEASSEESKTSDKSDGRDVSSKDSEDKAMDEKADVENHSERDKNELKDTHRDYSK